MYVAFLILKFNNVEKALVMNSSLALVGPIILIITTTIGLLGIAEKVSVTKLIWILAEWHVFFTVFVVINIYGSSK